MLRVYEENEKFYYYEEGLETVYTKDDLRKIYLSDEIDKTEEECGYETFEDWIFELFRCGLISVNRIAQCEDCGEHSGVCNGKCFDE